MGSALALATLLGVASHPPAAGAQEELFVTNSGKHSITVYARTASGATAPIRTLTGSATGLGTPTSLAVTSPARRSP